MLPSNSTNPNGQVSKAEIGFDVFPCGPCALEADKLLRSLDGVTQILFDPAVRRIAVHFDPSRVNLPLILSSLEPFGEKPRVVSVIVPMKRVS